MTADARRSAPRPAMPPPDAVARQRKALDDQRRARRSRMLADAIRLVGGTEPEIADLIDRALHRLRVENAAKRMRIRELELRVQELEGGRS